MITPFMSPKKSTKNLVVNLLLSNGSMDTAFLKRQLKTVYTTSITFQGLGKVLRVLEEDGVISKKRKLWSINSSWVSQVNDALQLSSGNNKQIYTPDMKHIEFSSLKDTINFIIKNIDSKAFHQGGEHIFVMHMNNIGFCNFSKEHIRLMKKIVKENKTLFFSVHDNIVCKASGLYYKSIGASVYLGVQSSAPWLTILVGNTLIYGICPKLRDYLDSSCKKIVSRTDSIVIELIESLHKQGMFRLKLKFETDSDVVLAAKENYLFLARKSRKL